MPTSRNEVIYKKSFEESLQNEEAKRITSKFVYLLYEIIVERLCDKEIEFKNLQDKLFEDEKIEYEKIIRCYTNATKLLNDEINQIVLNKDFFNPIECYTIMERVKFIVNREIFQPLKNVECESNFVHKLKNALNKFSSFIEKISFGKLNIGFFKPKPSFNEAKTIVNEVENVENAINAHFGIQI